MSEHDHKYDGDVEDPRPGPTWTIGLISCILFAATVLGVTAITYHVAQREIEQKVIGELGADGTMELRLLRDEQEARLHAAAHRELRAGNAEGEESVVIPIDDAIGIWVAEAAEKQRSFERTR